MTPAGELIYSEALELPHWAENIGFIPAMAAYRMSFGLALNFWHNGRCGFLRQVFRLRAGDHHFGLASTVLVLADLFEFLIHSPVIEEGGA
jgi:hypothetical protein